MFESKPFFMKISGNYALFTNPSSKYSGDRYTYSVPTKEALRGIADSVYFKPTFRNVIDEVKVINQITTESMGARTLMQNGSNDLNSYTYITNPVYLVKYHFEWNSDREDLAYDRNEIKHQEIMVRSLKKGGRRDIFLGVRECVGYVSKITKDEYDNASSYYEGQTISLGIMFNSFIYPKTPGEKLISCFGETVMCDGVIRFKSSEECEIKNTLDTYSFKYPDEVKAVDEEYKEYESFEEGV